jgi:3'-phosphoadenosine 5'-phosphosulfate sulfotransferase (PAPS reductase)/FAD synthetase
LYCINQNKVLYCSSIKTKKVVYDKYIVCFSGGKDSTAAFLHLLEEGVPVSKIELWHHEIDGREGGNFMDWDCTSAYCRAFAAAFNVPIYFSWKEGGFERELTRTNSLTAPTKFENDNGEIITVGGKTGKLSTRLKFPQVSADLKVRWCSAYLKIDICTTAIRNQDRFNGLYICVISGERGEESPARAKYQDLEADRADARSGVKKRYVDRRRPIKNYTEEQVWALIEKYKIRVHPCYYMGWNRCSCRFCIFGSADQFASANICAPAAGAKVMQYESEFGVTIKRNISLVGLIAAGKPYSAITQELIDLSNSTTYNLNILLSDWELPAGAYGESCGPN